jgi:hypothetical protein
MIGLLHCYYKDRSFVDPLLPDGVLAAAGRGGLLRGFSDDSVGGMGAAEAGVHSSSGGDDGEGAETGGPDVFLPEVALMDSDEAQSSDGESNLDDDADAGRDGVYLGWKKEGEESGTKSSTNESDTELPRPCVLLDDSRVSSRTKQGGRDGIEAGARGDHVNDKRTAESYERKRKAVIVIASGAQKFEKLSFSLSIPRINIKLHLPPSRTASGDEPRSSGKDGAESEVNHHCLELFLEGLVAECIWPKNSAGEMGGHVQGSIKYCHVLETAYREEQGTNMRAKQRAFGPVPCTVVKVCPLFRLGTRKFQGHDVFSLSPRLLGNDDVVNNATKCDEFPLMEDRQTTWTWERPGATHRALAFKSTISFIDEVRLVLRHLYLHKFDN